jgi:polysaccharide pyruvyl transferase WcaK-like protein
MSSKLPPMPLDLNRTPNATLEEQIHTVVKEIGQRKPLTPIDYAPKHHRLPQASSLPEDLEIVCRNLSNLLLGSAQNLVTEAQEHLTQTEKWLDQLHSEVQTRVSQHRDLTDRLKSFGESVLKAHNDFHNSSPGPSNDPT